MKPKRKRIYAGLLSAILALLLLAGCGGGGSGGDVTRNNPGGPPSDAPEVTEEPEEEEIPAPFRPVIGLTTDMDNHYDDDLNVMVNRMETELPGADAETRECYPELAAALDNFREDLLNTAREGYQEREDMLPDFIEMGGNGGDYEMYGNMNCMIRRADAQVVSIVNMWSEYAGGTHGSYGYSVSNFDTSTGEEIALETLLTDDGADALNERIAEKLDTFYPDITPGEEVAEYAPEDYTFSIEPDGVTFWFNPYEIASYADGLLTVKLYFNRDEDILNDAYASADEMWFVEFGENAPYRYNGAMGLGSVETWTLGSADGDDSFWNYALGLEFDAPEGYERWEGRPYAIDGDNPPDIPEGRAIVVDNIDFGFFDVHTYYVHMPYEDYTVALFAEEDDAQEIHVYHCSSGDFVQTLEMTGPGYFIYPEPPEDDEDIDWENYDSYRLTLSDPYNTQLQTRSDLFGTWSPAGSYRFTYDGFELTQELLYGSGFTLTLKQDLTVTRCDPDEWTVSTGEEITIPAGTEVDTVAVNPSQTAAWFRVPGATDLTNDDREFIFTLSYDNDEWPRTVDGIDEDELFDGLQYAG